MATRLKRTKRISKATPQKMLRSTRTAHTAMTQGRQAAEQTTKTAVRRAAQVAATVEDIDDDVVDPGSAMNQDLAEKLLNAVRYAVDMWKVSAMFRNVKIYAISATGSPGCLTGPDLESLIAMAPGTAAMQGVEAELRDAVAEGVAECFGAWQDQVTIPGLPWYPAFAAFPGPQAPPMPNVPTPLIACVSSMVSKIVSPSELSNAMTEALPDALRVPEVEAGFAAMGQSLAMAFSTWLPSAQVMPAMGRGPIPSFSPPYVPVGPVVNGEIIPGQHLSSAPPLTIVMPPGMF